MAETPHLLNWLWVGSILSACYILSVYQENVNGQLVVNARNRGGETIVENITANTSADTVTLELLNSDGSFVTQFIDFKSVRIQRLDPRSTNSLQESWKVKKKISLASKGSNQTCKIYQSVAC